MGLAKDDVLLNTRYYITEELTTPYFRPIVKDDEPFDNVPAPQSNYIPYDLFVFRTKFEYYLATSGYPEYTFRFVSKIDGDVTRVTIELYNGKQFIVLSKSLAEKFQNAIDNILVTHPDYCLLLDMNLQFDYDLNHPQIPKGWLSAIINYFYLEVDIEGVSVLADKGKLYIDLRQQHTNYDDYYLMFYKLFSEKVENYFYRGIVPCSETFHSTVIENFNLKMIYQIDAGLGGDTINLYEATWNNPTFAPNKLLFLYDRLRGVEMMNIHVGDSFVRRHFVAAALYDLLLIHKSIFPENYLPLFSGEDVLVPCPNIDVCKYLAYKIQEAQNEAEGKVEIFVLKNDEEIERRQKDIEDLYPNIDLGKHVLAYKQMNQVSTILSFLLPNYVSSDTLNILK